LAFGEPRADETASLISETGVSFEDIRGEVSGRVAVAKGAAAAG